MIGSFDGIVPVHYGDQLDLIGLKLRDEAPDTPERSISGNPVIRMETIQRISLWEKLTRASAWAQVTGWFHSNDET